MTQHLLDQRHGHPTLLGHGGGIEPVELANEGAEIPGTASQPELDHRIREHETALAG